MKHLLMALFVCGATVALADDSATAKAVASEAPKVAECFKVHWLLKADDSHYWADWSNECPAVVDAVYVMVGFQDKGHKELGNGVWPMYFVLPGVHQVTRFSAPAEVEGFDNIKVHRITTDSAEAFSQDRNTVESVQRAARPAAAGDPGFGRASTGDPGPRPRPSR